MLQYSSLGKSKTSYILLEVSTTPAKALILASIAVTEKELEGIKKNLWGNAKGQPQRPEVAFHVQILAFLGSETLIVPF